MVVCVCIGDLQNRLLYLELPNLVGYTLEAEDVHLGAFYSNFNSSFNCLKIKLIFGVSTMFSTISEKKNCCTKIKIILILF